MKLLWVMAIGMFIAGAVAWGETASATSATCDKNVSFAVAEKGQPVPAIPKVAAKWISDKKHQKEYSGVCFSQIPSPNVKSYVIVISSAGVTLDGLVPTAHTYTRTPPSSNGTTATSSFGGTWDYSYAGLSTVTITNSVDLARVDKSNLLYVRAYDQQGGLVSQRSSDRHHSKEKILDQALADIRSDSAAVPKQRPYVVPLSVYYVNCDVDAPAVSPPVESSPKLSSSPVSEVAAAVEPVLDVWSNPAGTDVYIDGVAAGKTPMSLPVAPGEHTITVRKTGFTTWQRKLQVVSGERRVIAYLEQKVVILGSIKQ